MEHLVQQYLFRYKYCPLPAIGTLELKDGTAEVIIGENRMRAPVPQIIFNTREREAGDFTRFIAAKNKIAFEEAVALLEQFCQKLANMELFRELNLGYIGRFFPDASGKLAFKQEGVQPAFLPDVISQRVIRPDAIHQVRVGDTETTNVAMTEYYSETEASPRSKWWILAVVLLAIGIAGIVMYFQDPAHSSLFGNAIKAEPGTAAATYQPVN